MSQSREVVTTANVAVTLAAETVITTLPGVQQNFDGAPILLDGWMQFNPGTNTTAVTLRIRRGVDTSGTLVGEANAETAGVAAGAIRGQDLVVVDNPAAGGPYTYVLTCQQTAGTVDGAALQTALSATVEGPSGT